jgi:peptide/nickel transport system substrate-binding protein
MSDNYWTRKARRRKVLQGGGAAALGAAALALVGCGDDDNSGSKASATAKSTQPAGGSATAAAGSPKPGGTIRSGVLISVLGIDPHIETSVGLNQACRIYSTLIAYDPDNNKVNPVLSESLEQPTTSEYVFHLRKDAKFQNIAPVNGRPVVAEDVKYSFERFRDLPQATRNGFFKTLVDKMEVIDDNTFKLTTKKPYVETFGVLGIGDGMGPPTQIVAKEDVEKRGDLSNGGVGSGPYIVDKYSKGEFTGLKKNPDYWEKGLPYPDAWNTQTITDNQTLLQAYKSGQLDINGASLTKLDFEDLEKNDNFVTAKVQSLSNGCFEMDAGSKPFNDPRVRQAVKIGMDRSQFIDKIFYGEAKAAGAFSSGLSFWALPEAELEPFVKHDPQKAKELLASAGYPDGFDLEIDSASVSVYQDYAQIVVAELKKLGINAKQSLTDIGTFVAEHMYVGKFPSAVWATNGYPTLVTPLNYYHENGLGNGNWWHYKNDEVTALVDQQFEEFDAEKRKAIVLDIQRKVLSDWAPHMPLVDGLTYSSYSKKIGGYDPKKRSYQLLLHNEYVKA